MHVRHPIWLQRLTTPGADAIAILFALESFARALLASLIPLEAYRILADAGAVSLLFFGTSLAGLWATLCVPWLVRRMCRRWIYSLGAILLVVSPGLLLSGTLEGQIAGMVVRVLGVVGLGVCLSLYIMDHIKRRDYGHSEPKRMLYSAIAWTAGPGLGVYLGSTLGPWSAYALSAASAFALLCYFWFLRMTDNPIVAPQSKSAPRMLRNLHRFLAQPRLVLAWLISISRYAWWAMFFIYTPIYAVETGIGAVTGGLIVSAGTGFLFLMPLWGWCLRSFGMRDLLVTGFAIAGLLSLLVGLVSQQPWLAASFLIAAAMAMGSLDAVGNSAFMLAVKPRERPEMTAVYSTYRDVGEIAPPGIFALLLRVFELPAVFVAGGLAMLTAAYVCRRMHPRLGRSRRVAAGLLVAGTGSTRAPAD